MTFDEAMHFWFGRINYEQKPPRPGDFTLGRLRHLLERLGDPHRRYRIFHLAGSKGKGSTSAMLAAVLRAQGYRTGLFTSPHLVDVAERFQVDGEPISREELVARIGEIHTTAQALRCSDGQPLADTLTFFEIATAIGFLHFAYRRVEWAVLEVGLGGRLDATSICMPETSIIASISFDHVEMLGDTLAKIAGEKAGIVKPDRPVVSGVTQPEAAEVIAERCRQVGAPLRVLGRDFRFRYEPARIEAHRSGRVTVETWRRHYRSLPLGLVGEHQAANAAVAVAALETARERGLAVTDRAIAEGLANVTWPARLEVVGEAPLVVLDCAHNVASAEALRDALLTSFRVPGERVLLFGISKDKDAAGMLAVLQPIFRHIVLTRFEKNPRAVPPEQLRAMLSSDHGVHIADHPLEALKAARELMRPDDLLCITGSVFLAGELRPVLVDRRPSRSLAIGYRSAALTPSPQFVEERPCRAPHQHSLRETGRSPSQYSPSRSSSAVKAERTVIHVEQRAEIPSTRVHDPPSRARAERSSGVPGNGVRIVSCIVVERCLHREFCTPAERCRASARRGRG